MKHVSTNDTSRTAIQRSFFTVVYSNTLDFLDKQMHAFRAKLINDGDKSCKLLKPFSHYPMFSKLKHDISNVSSCNIYYRSVGTLLMLRKTVLRFQFTNLPFKNNLTRIHNMSKPLAVKRPSE